MPRARSRSAARDWPSQRSSSATSNSQSPVDGVHRSLDDREREALVARELEEPHPGGLAPDERRVPAFLRRGDRGLAGAHRVVGGRGGSGGRGGVGGRRRRRLARRHRRGAEQRVLDLYRAAALGTARLRLRPVGELGLVEAVPRLAGWADDDHRGSPPPRPWAGLLRSEDAKRIIRIRRCGRDRMGRGVRRGGRPGTAFRQRRRRGA